MKVNVYFVTNRKHQPQNKRLIFGDEINPHGVAALRFGKATVEVSEKSTSVRKVTVYSEKLTAGGFVKKGSDRFFSELKVNMEKNGTDTSVFIHGFNVDFMEALIAGAKIAANNNKKGSELNIVVLTWPSDGSTVPFMSYYSDREDALASGAAVARALLLLNNFVTNLKSENFCNQSIHLVAHSMGTYVLRHGLQALIAKDPNNLIRIFDQIVLVASDEDDDAFETENKLGRLPSLCRQITIYFNRRDRALAISDNRPSSDNSPTTR